MMKTNDYSDNDDYHVSMVRMDRDSDCVAMAMKRNSAEHEDDQYWPGWGNEALGTHQGETVGGLNSAAVWEHLKQGGEASL